MLRTRIIANTAAAAVVSVVFASTMTLVNRAETFVEPFRVEPGVAAPLTLRIPGVRVVGAEGAGAVHPEAGIVPRGEIVEDGELAGLVRAFEDERRPPDPADLFGLFFFYFLIALMVTTYLRGLSPGRGALLRTQLGLMGLAAVLLALAKVFLLLTPYPAHVVPVAALTIWAALFLDRQTALVVGLAMAFVAASLVNFRLSCMAVYLASSVTAVLIMGDKKRPTRILQAGAAASVAAAGVYVAARVIFDGGFDLSAELASPWRSPMIASASGGLASGVVAWALAGVAVMILGSVSRARLVELSDLDQPLLKKIAREAPGSWEHSRAMANLAEGAANAIGADALLTRVGAYYHDLGKTCQASYFVENLQPGEPTPHRNIPPDLSADAIMAHVVEGVGMLRGGGIPEPVVEFAYTHHGTSVIEYFWHKTIEEGNPRDREEIFFRYPGMRPRTKETAIVMLVDSIEAASRTIDPPERDRFEEMVQRIIFVKLRQGQLDECGLTMAELRTVSAQIVESLCSIYHSRIKYPWQEREGQRDSTSRMPGAATEEDVARARTDADQAADDEPTLDSSEEGEGSHDDSPTPPPEAP